MTTNISYPYPLGNRRFWTAIFLLAIFLNLVLGCNYYKIKSRHADDPDFKKSINETLNDQNLVLLVQDSSSYLAEHIDFDERSLIVKLDSLPHELVSMHAELEQIEGTRFKAKEHKAIVHEVRIYPNENTKLVLGTNTIPLNDIQRIDIYDHDTGLEILNWVGVTVGIFAVFILIVALTKSSCPYVYSHNGQNYVYEGESYGGAIFKSLERMDYLLLKGIDTIDRTKTIKIANNLKERQFIDQLELIELRTPPGVKALIDKNGVAHSFQNPHTPLMAIADQKDYSEQLVSPDDGSFVFDRGDTDKSYIDLQFPNEYREGKLIINAKGSLWLDYLYGEFSKLFGDRYTSFIEHQYNRSAKELNQWIRDQDLLLSVYEQTNTGWELIDRFDMVGPLGDGRDIVMSIPINPEAGKTRNIRLETGFMFWELNYAAIDYSPNQIIQLSTKTSFRALDHTGVNQNGLLTSDDSRYLEQQKIGDFVTVNFKTDPLNPLLSSHYFLGIKGYYEHIRDFEGAPQLTKLRMFREPGYFSEYSRTTYYNLYSDLLAVSSEAF